MDRTEINETLNEYAQRVVEEARANAIADFPKGSGDLANSLTWGINDSDTEGIELIFWGEPYAAYVDAGVYGADPSLVKGGKQKGKKTDSVFLSDAKTRFSYKLKRPPMQDLRVYVARNKMRFRNPKGQSDGGQFRKGTYTTIAYWLANRIYAQGIAPSLFFTKPFLKYFDGLADKLELKIIQQFDNQTKN
tara:strand:+ start:17692 stop:18264 length:573 start_codon:yes stop_codon:yes gene_type:complete